MSAATESPVLVSGPGSGPIAEAVKDFREGFAQSRLWLFLARREIGRQFDRTTIGFLWVPLSVLFHVGLLGPVFSIVFGVEKKSYFAYFALSYAVWKPLTLAIGESSTMWTRAEKYVRHVPIPRSTFLYMITAKDAMLLALSLPVGIAFSVWYTGGLKPVALFSLLGCLVLLVNIAWGATVFGIIALRFRDVQRFVPTLIFMLYLGTPVLWQIERLGEHTWIANVNPLYHVMELIRAPLLGRNPAALSWIVGISTALVGNVVAFFAFTYTRKKLPLWM